MKYKKRMRMDEMLSLKRRLFHGGSTGILYVEGMTKSQVGVSQREGGKVVVDGPMGEMEGVADGRSESGIQRQFESPGSSATGAIEWI